MISLKELQQKAQRPWTSGAFLKSVLSDEQLFPLEITFRKPSGKTLSQDYAKVRNWIAPLHNNSKAVKGSGYRMEYRNINHQQLGSQRIPGRILFDKREDWLGFIGKVKAFRQFDKLAGSTRQALPELLPWLQLKPSGWNRNVSVMAGCWMLCDFPAPSGHISAIIPHW